MNTQGTINEKERLLIKVGASIAATNQESFKEAFDDLVVLGAGFEEMKFASGIGQAVREKPAEEMKKYTERLLGIDQFVETKTNSCPAQKMKENTNYRLMMLIAVGSAVAANCEPCLNQSVLALKDVKVHEDDIRIAAEIGLQIKELKLEDIRDVAVVLTGIEEERRVA